MIFLSINMKLDKLYFATGNKYKLKEAQEILNIEVEPVNLDIDEIQEIDIDKVVRKKALESYLRFNQPVFVEDTGLFFNALNGFPGALIKWLMISIGTNGSLENGSNNINIINLLRDFEDKTAYAKTSVGFAFSDNIEDIIVESGLVNGRIPEKNKGKRGFGWDDMFIPNGYKKTFAELGMVVKNKISMRKEALKKLNIVINKFYR